VSDRLKTLVSWNTSVHHSRFHTGVSEKFNSRKPFTSVTTTHHLFHLTVRAGLARP
jgi:hypothetical protein